MKIVRCDYERYSNFLSSKIILSIYWLSVGVRQANAGPFYKEKKSWLKKGKV